LRLYEYAIRRLILMVFVLLAVSVLVFVLARAFIPPSVTLSPYITPRMDAAAKLSIARAVGVATDSCPSFTAFTTSQPGCIVPLWGQYYAWLSHALSGNWGFTLLPGISGTATTWHVFFGRFPYTVELALGASILTIILGIPLGIVSATHNNKLPDHLSRIFSLGGYSVPQFWFAAILQLIFALYIRVNGLGLLPASGALATTCGVCFSNPGTITSYSGLPMLDALLSLNGAYFWDSFVALILPSLALAITSIGALTRIVRSSMLEVLRQDYILQARSKGLRERVVIYRHALRNAVIPAATISGLLVSYFLGGAVIIEIVFSWPGVGNALLSAVNVLDVNFIELFVIVAAAIIVVTNLVVDLVVAKLDPRIRY
jgi:peptide/nickel transport system permease protein